MGWVKHADDFYSNPRARRAGPLGRDLFRASWCHCSIQNNDGTFDAFDLPLLLAQSQVTQDIADLLIEIGLWIDHGDKIEVKDYLKYNPSSAERAERSAKASAAANASHAKRNAQRTASSTAPSSANGTANGVPLSSSSPIGTPVVSLPVQPADGPESAIDDDLPTGVWREYAALKLTVTAGVKNAKSWKDKVAANARSELLPDALRLHANYDLRPTELARALLAEERGEPTAWLRNHRRETQSA